VAAGGSNLNNDNLPANATDTFARRRHLRRVIDAVRIFRELAARQTRRAISTTGASAESSRVDDPA